MGLLLKQLLLTAKPFASLLLRGLFFHSLQIAKDYLHSQTLKVPAPYSFHGSFKKIKRKKLTRSVVHPFLAKVCRGFEN